MLSILLSPLEEEIWVPQVPSVVQQLFVTLLLSTIIPLLQLRELVVMCGACQLVRLFLVAKEPVLLLYCSPQEIKVGILRCMQQMGLVKLLLFELLLLLGVLT